MSNINYKVEQETTINMFHPSVSKTAEIYTCIPNVVQHLKKLYEDYPEDVAIVEGDCYVMATVPRGWIKIQPKRKSNMTEEQKKVAAERLIALNKQRMVQKDDAT